MAGLSNSEFLSSDPAFSDDLAFLEQALRIDDPDVEDLSPRPAVAPPPSVAQPIQAQPTPRPQPISKPAVNAADKAAMTGFTQGVSRAVTEGILSQLSDVEVLERFLDVKSLKKDNQVLASQVRRLMQEIKTLRDEMAESKKCLSQFKKIAGNLYLLMD